MTETTRWNAVLRRDRRADGRFVFAVKTTGIYCRPSCPARRPKRTNVRFYSQPARAEADGFRACKRCVPDRATTSESSAMIRAAARLIQDDPSIGLAGLAGSLGWSQGHIQKTFRRELGLSPRQFSEAVQQGAFRTALREGESIAASQNQAGLSSSSRVYERSTAWLGMTPGRYRHGGAGENIRFGFGRSSMGQVLVAATEKGVCAVRLGDRRGDLETVLREEFPAARLTRDDDGVDTALTRIIEGIDTGRRIEGVSLDVQATAFQSRVWRALSEIPAGETRTYLEVARSIGRPRAVRAVASACAANPVAVVVPCHRVVRTDGGMGGYRWGLERKEKLLAREAERD